jgi:hypothetical protein
VISANLAVLFDIQAVLESLFVFVGAVTNAFAFFALHFDGVILRHTGLKRIGPILRQSSKKRKSYPLLGYDGSV